MATRQQLQKILEEMLNSRNVYYQPPESITMAYPAIRYALTNINTKYANNQAYKNLRCYEIIVISKAPDNPVVDKILGLPYCSYSRHYVSDNLHHDVLSLYY
jgi:hypothetical protein